MNGSNTSLVRKNVADRRDAADAPAASDSRTIHALRAQRFLYRQCRPAARSQAIDSTAGNKYHLYIHDADAFHTLFELNAAKCTWFVGVNQQKCDETVRWLSSAGLAFLVGHVRQLPAALQWLQSNRIEVARGGVAEWQRK